MNQRILELAKECGASVSAHPDARLHSDPAYAQLIKFVSFELETFYEEAYRDGQKQISVAEDSETNLNKMAIPWHIGFHGEIADMVRPSGDWHPDAVRYEAVQVCDHDGKHVCWAKSPEHAALIVEAVNKMANYTGRA